jgi:hypothetical protein
LNPQPRKFGFVVLGSKQTHRRVETNLKVQEARSGGEKSLPNKGE